MDLTFPAVALVRRELLSSLRRPRSFVLVLLFLAAAATAILTVWPDTTHLPGDARQLAAVLASRVSLLLFGASLLFVPALAAGAIVLEREQDTFDMLYTALIHPWGIVLGKLINALGFFLLIVVSALPVMSVAFFVSGLEWGEVARALAVVVCSALACASMGLLSSAWFRKPYGAIIGAYLGVLLLQIGTPIFAFFVTMVLGIVSTIAPGASQTLGFAADIATPFRTLEAIFAQRLSDYQIALALLYELAFAALALGLTLTALRRVPAPARVVSAKPIDDPNVLRMRRQTFPYYLVDPMRRKKPVEDGLNPMLVKELRWGLLNDAGRLIRIFYLSLGFYFLAGLPALYVGGNFESLLWFLSMQIGISVVVAPALLASALTKEYETGNIDMLRMTLLRPRQIIVGKLFAGVFVLGPMVLGAVLASLPGAVLIKGQASLLLTGYTTLILCCVLSLCLSLVASMLTRRTPTAIVLTYLLSILVFMGSSGVAMAFGHNLSDRRFVEDGSNPLLNWLESPILVFLGNAKINTSTGLLTPLWLGNLLVYALICYGLVCVSVTGFSRFRRRDT